MSKPKVSKQEKDAKGNVTGVVLGPGTPDQQQQLASAVQEIQAHLEAAGGFTPAHKIDAARFGKEVSGTSNQKK